MLVNIKTAIVVNCKTVRKEHVGRSLAGFEWRFNHRADLQRWSPPSAAPLPPPNQSPTGGSSWLTVVP